MKTEPERKSSWGQLSRRLRFRFLSPLGEFLEALACCERCDLTLRYKWKCRYQLTAQHWLPWETQDGLSWLIFMNLLISSIWPLCSRSYLWETISRLLGDFESYCNPASCFAWWFHCLWVWLPVTHIPQRKWTTETGNDFISEWHEGKR